MNFNDQIERLNKVNTLIRSEKTGTPFEFAQKINCSRSQLYIIIDYLKSHNAPIKYSKTHQTFYFEHSCTINLEFSLSITNRENTRSIFHISSQDEINCITQNDSICLQ
jgi:hypothetical protein